MVNTNKILTVSYGTFSCTLEGFDDSFGTMKAIAEYFRDLAADDRYFGAEPPTPDAEMLARIAEREIARRVEAHFEENKIVLRADPGAALPLAAQAAAPAQADTREEEPETAAPVAEEPVAEAPEEPAEEPTASVAEQPAEQEDIAEPEETRASEAPAEELSAETEELPAEPELQEEPAEAALPEIAEEEAPAEAAETEAEAEAEAEDEPAGLEIAYESAVDASYLVEVPEDAPHDLAMADDESEDMAQDEAAEATLEPDSVAAKLQRIRAVVSATETEDEPASAYSEDEHADDFLADAHHDIEAAMEIDDAAELASISGDDHEADDDISALLSRFDSPSDDKALFDEDQDEETAFALDAIPGFDDDEPEADTLPEATAETVDHDDEAGDDAGDHPQLHARIIKMKRADFEAAVAEGQLEEDAEGEAQSASSLSPEDEADLLRELAAVEAELDDDEAEDDGFAMGETAYDDDEEEPESYAGETFAEDDEDDDEEDTFEDAANLFADDAEEGRRPEPFADHDSEAEMGRIFEETDAHLKEETGRGRRNAIAHLRAAVAANKAELGAGGDLAGDGPDSEVYRDDLASVVQPRRPQMRDAGGRTRRPEGARPAPLKLVAEQRVDLDEAESAAPVRPRRVRIPAPVSVDEAASAGDFAEYAENMGATSLPELLEAAAAYLSFVEGREQFSRPQLMTHVRQVEQEDFSREDGLRSFGQLLREGKIVKLKGGRFAASDSISYRPDARYAGE